MSLNRAQLFEVLRDAFNRAYPGDIQATLETLANLLTPVWDGSVAYSVKSVIFNGGAIGDGVASDRDAIQAAIDWSAQNRLAISIPDGDYRIDGPLYARSYASVVCTPQARLIRNFTQSGTTGLLMNETMTTQIKRFRWSGGCISNPGTLVRDGSVTYEPGTWTGASLAGNSVCLYGDAETEISDLFVDEWSARAFLLFGDLKMRRCRAISVQDGGGIRYAGWGKEFRAIDCHVVCGDDALQFVPTGSTGSVGFNQDMVGGQYIGCTGFSWNARFMAVILLSASETLHMTNSIRDCGWIGCHGRGARALTIENEDSVGKIAGITVSDCSVQMTKTTTFAAVGISANTGTGGVEDVAIHGLRIRSPSAASVEVRAADVRNVTFINCVFDKPQTAATVNIDLRLCSGITFRNCRASGNGADVASVGIGSASANTITFDHCQFDEIDNSVAGIRLVASIGALIRRCTFIQRSGQTIARGISLGAAASVQQVVIEGPHNVAGLSLQEWINPFTNNGTSQNRIDQAVAVITDSGARTLRNSDCGTVIQNNGATALCVYSLPAATVGLFYSFAVIDDDGIKAQCAAGDKIRSGATLGAATGSITSTTIGDTLTLRCVQAGEWLAMPATGTWTVT